MKQRLLFAYAGAIMLPILLVPVAAAYTMGGHSLMYVTLLGFPLGMILGMAYSDKRRNYNIASITIRSFAALIISIAVVYFVSSIRVPAIMYTQGWATLPFITPAIAASVSERILRESTQPGVVAD